MKKLFVLILIISFLFSADLNTKIEYGLKLYNDYQYKKAYNFFDKLFKQNLENERINFYLGLCAFKLEKYDKAVEAFERILIKNPTNNRVRVEYARALFYLGNYKQSKQEFLKVMQANIPIEVKSNIKKFLILIDELQKRNFYNLLLSINIKHDNNINNDVGSDTIIHDTIFDINSTGNAKKHDFINEDLFVLNYIRDIGKIGGWRLDNNFIAFSQNYFRYTKNNILYFSIAPGIDFKKDNSMFKSQIFFNSIRLNNNPYLNIYGINFTFFKQLNNFLVNPFIGLKRKDFISNNNLNAINRNFTLSLIQKLYKSKINYSFSYINEDAKMSVENSYSKKDIKLRYDKNLNKFIWNLGYEFFEKKYKNKSNIFLKRRKDFQHKIKTSLTYKVKNHFNISYFIIYIKNNSTRNMYEYDKLINGLSGIIFF